MMKIVCTLYVPMIVMVFLMSPVLTLKPLNAMQRSILLKSALPSSNLHRMVPMKRGGAFQDDTIDDSMFEPFETLSEFATLRHDFHIPSSTQRNIFKRNQKKIGLALMTTGFICTLLGMLLFFEGNLLRIGNLSFVLGTSLLVGPLRVTRFFMQPKRIRATASLVLGIFLVLIKWSKLGILCEIFGIFNLFGNMFPLLYRILRSLPVVGDIIKAFEGNSSPPQRNKLLGEEEYYGHTSEEEIL